MKVSAVLVYLKCLLAQGGKQEGGRAFLALSRKGWQLKKKKIGEEQSTWILLWDQCESEMTEGMEWFSHLQSLN